MKKIKLINVFHNTEVIILSDCDNNLDAWTELQWNAYGRQDPKAIRKMKRVEKELCGCDDCKCGTFRPK